MPSLILFTFSQRVAKDGLTLDRVHKAIAALPEDQREVLVLVCLEENSYLETAEILDIPLGTVMSRLARARKRLMTLVEQDNKKTSERGAK